MRVDQMPAGWSRTEAGDTLLAVDELLAESRQDEVLELGTILT